jgi:hypothetical protein
MSKQELARARVMEFDVDVPPSVIANEMYKASAAGETVTMAPPERIVARAIPLKTIRLDPAQPRRGIPLETGARRGDTLEMLRAWYAEMRKRRVFDLEALLRNQDMVPVVEGDAELAEWLDLVSLAASIHADGLINPITVYENGHGYIVETGERRYLAYTLLAGTLKDAAYESIPARVTKRDVWRQAAENGRRRPLTAIGMARQLAILLMDMYAHDAGVFFEAYNAITLDGAQDRRFYAQVANGNVYRVKKGLADRVMQVTGLGSPAQISQYRSLLSIPDDLWAVADREDWPERKIRDVGNYMTREGATISEALVAIAEGRAEERADTLASIDVESAADADAAPHAEAAPHAGAGPDAAGMRANEMYERFRAAQQEELARRATGETPAAEVDDPATRLARIVEADARLQELAAPDAAEAAQAAGPAMLTVERSYSERARMMARFPSLRTHPKRSSYLYVDYDRWRWMHVDVPKDTDELYAQWRDLQRDAASAAMGRKAESAPDADAAPEPEPDEAPVRVGRLRPDNLNFLMLIAAHAKKQRGEDARALADMVNRLVQHDIERFEISEMVMLVDDAISDMRAALIVELEQYVPRLPK